MAQWISLLTLLFVVGCAHSNKNQQVSDEDNKVTGRFVSSHETHFPHTHKHGEGCGHATETVGFDTVYLHDGHKHKVHADHVDDVQ